MTERIIAIIAAVSEGGVYGINGKLPWEHVGLKLILDMQNFKKKTEGNVIIMGRKTWESFRGRPLPNRTHIVVTSQKQNDGLPSCVHFVPSVEMAVALADEIAKEKNIYFIGGKKIWEAGFSYANTLCVTQIRNWYAHKEGDIVERFPDLWNIAVTYGAFHESDRDEIRTCPSGVDYDIITYNRQ